MNQDSRQPKRPIKVQLVVLWHWLIVVAIAWGALLCLLGQIMGGENVLFWAQFLGAGLFGWSIWATKTGIAFIQDQDAALLTMQRVHRSVKYTAGFGAIGSLLFALILLTAQNWITAFIAIFLMLFAFCCLVVWVISHRVTRTLDELDINS